MHTSSFSSASTHHAARGRRSFWNSIRTAMRVMRERGELAALSEERLMDLGLTAAQAGREAKRPIWDLPQGR